MGHDDQVNRIAALFRIDPPPSSEKALHDHILAILDAMPADRREPAVASLTRLIVDGSRRLPTWHQMLPRQSWNEPGPTTFTTPGESDGWGIVLLITLGVSPSQVMQALGRVNLDEARRSGRADPLIQALTAQPRDWAERFVQAAADPAAPAGACWAADLLIEHHDLDLPDSPTLWATWIRDLPDPRPGYRWQDRFIKVCSLPETLQHSSGGSVDTIAPHIRQLLGEELRRDDLFRALLGVIDRGDSRSCQRNAAEWITWLGLNDLIAEHRALVIPAIRNAAAKALTLLVTELLAAGLTQQELPRVALPVLASSSKTLRRQVIEACAAITEPDDDLVAALEVTATDDDLSIAVPARELLADWGRESAPSTHGLWRKAAGSTPSAPSEVPSVLDDAALAELLGTVLELTDPLLSEQRLAQLVTTAAARGRDVVVTAIQDLLPATSQFHLRLGRLLHLWVQEDWGRVAGLDFLAPDPPPFESESRHNTLGELNILRVFDTLDHLGEIPVLLSTPDLPMMRLSWEGFRARLDQYRDAGCAVLPSDVAVALGRLDRAGAPTGWDGFAVAVKGFTSDLAELLQAWLATPITPPSLLVDKSTLSHRRPQLTARGDEAGHALLGLTTAWDHPYRPQGSSHEERWSLQLLPNHPHRAETHVLSANHGAFAASAGPFCAVAEVAPRFSELLSFGVLATLSDIDAKDRPEVARVLVAAWDRGAVTADDLLAAWRSELRDGWPPAPAKLALACRVVAELGGLSLMWPLLVKIAEEAARARRLTNATGLVLEVVLALLPEVQAAGVVVELPAVEELATRTGTAKAIAVARAIVEAMG